MKNVEEKGNLKAVVRRSCEKVDNVKTLFLLQLKTRKTKTKAYRSKEKPKTRESKNITDIPISPKDLKPRQDGSKIQLKAALGYLTEMFDFKVKKMLFEYPDVKEYKIETNATWCLGKCGRGILLIDN